MFISKSTRYELDRNINNTRECIGNSYSKNVLTTCLSYVLEYGYGIVMWEWAQVFVDLPKYF